MRQIWSRVNLVIYFLNKPLCILIKAEGISKHPPMNKLRLGIVREGKVPPDKRVPLLPDQCAEVLSQFSRADITVQPSDIRCIANSEYVTQQIKLDEDLSSCDVLMGIKEVPAHLLIPNKTYLFFSHTIKKQPHNKHLLQTALEKKVTLIDYECLTDSSGKRVIAFGRFAGIVGAYNAILNYGKKFQLFDLERAYRCFDYTEIREELDKARLPAIKIVLTGGGRVGHGAMEVLEVAGVKKVSPDEFISQKFDVPVYTQLNSRDYHQRKDKGPWNNDEFHAHPELYESTFKKFLPVTDILIAGAYWDPAAPMLFTKEDMLHDFKIKVIADITCDIGGSIPSTVKPSTIHDPCYDYNPLTSGLEAPFSGENNITVMAIDNLPGEIPRNSSRDFGEQLIRNVLPYIFGPDPQGIIERGTICRDGKLMPDFKYLQDYVD
jgi:saccharopine dehydrogenase (NAD+, L-lysine forming)